MTSVVLISDSSERSGALAGMIRNRLHYSLHVLPLSAIREWAEASRGASEIIVLDINPAALDTLSATIAAVKQHRQRNAILVLYPFGDQDAEGKAILAGVDEMLARPVTLERLKLSLHNLVKLQRIQSMLHQDENIGNGLRHALALFTASGDLRSLRSIEAEVIACALAHYQGRISRAARALGLGRSTLYRKIDELNLTLPDKTGVPSRGPDAYVYNSCANQTTRPIIRVSATGRS